MQVIIKFWKMHGAGNDFILIDDRLGQFPASDLAWIKQICSPHNGVGAEGLILLQSSDETSFFMRFFNPDGAEADMCGNGLRCAARLAHNLGIAEKEMTIKTNSGLLKAAIMENSVRVAMPLASGIRLNFTVQADEKSIICNFINTGVPHAVVETDNLEAVDLQRIGPLLRRHKDFAPQGANVDYMRVTGGHSLSVRTYERGVEGETLACGTGITACAIVAVLNNRLTPPVQATCRHGDTLEVDFKISGNSIENVTLSGPAEYVFEGEISYEEGAKAQGHKGGRA
jgi:diaminopimelate epimerase